MAQRWRLFEMRWCETIRGWMAAQQPALIEANVFYLSLVAMRGGESKGYMIWVWGEGNDVQWVHICVRIIYVSICMQICTYAPPPPRKTVNHGASDWGGWVEVHNHNQGGLPGSSTAEWLVWTPSNTTKTSMLVTWGRDRWVSQCVRYRTENRKKKKNQFISVWTKCKYQHYY